MSEDIKYPCADCGVLRTKDEGGTTFTVCDDCWDKHYKKKPRPPELVPIDEDEVRAYLTDRIAEILRERGDSHCYGEQSFEVAEIYVPQIMSYLKQFGQPKKLGREEIVKIIKESDLYIPGIDICGVKKLADAIVEAMEKLTKREE